MLIHNCLTYKSVAHMNTWTWKWAVNEVWLIKKCPGAHPEHLNSWYNNCYFISTTQAFKWAPYQTLILFYGGVCNSTLSKVCFNISFHLREKFKGYFWTVISPTSAL